MSKSGRRNTHTHTHTHENLGKRSPSRQRDALDLIGAKWMLQRGRATHPKRRSRLPPQALHNVREFGTRHLDEGFILLQLCIHSNSNGNSSRW
jgi:hypothetical protein